MTEWTGENRRKNPRIKYPCLLVLKDAEEKDSAFMVETENISIGGIAIIAKQNIKMLSVLMCELDLGLEERICFEGKVVWNIQRNAASEDKPAFFDIGIAFVKIEKEDVERINSVVTNLKDKTDREDFFIIQRTKKE